MAKRGGYPGGGSMNMNNMMQQAQKMQKQLEQAQKEFEKAQEEVKDFECEGTSGGGMVKAVASGDLEIKSIKIDPEVVDPEDVEMLEDLVAAAVNEALRNVSEKASGHLDSASGGFDIPGFGNMPGLGGMAGLGR